MAALRFVGTFSTTSCAVLGWNTNQARAWRRLGSVIFEQRASCLRGVGHHTLLTKYFGECKRITHAQIVSSAERVLSFARAWTSYRGTYRRATGLFARAGCCADIGAAT